jgi:predicted ATPase
MMIVSRTATSRRPQDWQSRAQHGPGSAAATAPAAKAMPGNSGGGVWFVDLAPTPALVEVATARALGLPDQPGGSTTDTLLRFIRDPHMLMAR